MQKTAINACVNITRGINTYESLKKYVMPSIPSISCYTKVISALNRIQEIVN